MATIKQSIEQKIVDMNTGQIVESRENITKNWGTEPPFIKLYLQDILFLSDLPKAHNTILLALLKRAGWANDGMEISLTAGTKRLMLKELNFKSIRTINNALSDFVRTKILYRIETGVYRFNPYLFGKGDWQDISRLRLTIDYSFQGKTFGSIISYQSQQQSKVTIASQNIASNVSDNHTGDFRQSGNTDIPKIKKIAQKASSEVLEVSKYPHFVYKSFMKLKPEKLINIKKTQYWLLTLNNHKQIYCKNGKFFVNFLTTNPDENLKSKIELALDNYEDCEAESSAS